MKLSNITLNILEEQLVKAQASLATATHREERWVYAQLIRYLEYDINAIKLVGTY